MDSRCSWERLFDILKRNRPKKIIRKRHVKPNMLLTQIKVMLTGKEMNCGFETYDNYLEFQLRIHKMLSIAKL